MPGLGTLRVHPGLQRLVPPVNVNQHLFVPLAQGRVAVRALIDEVPGFRRTLFENCLLARIGTVTIKARLLAIQHGVDRISRTP